MELETNIQTAVYSISEYAIQKEVKNTEFRLRFCAKTALISNFFNCIKLVLFNFKMRYKSLEYIEYFKSYWRLGSPVFWDTLYTSLLILKNSRAEIFLTQQQTAILFTAQYK